MSAPIRCLDKSAAKSDASARWRRWAIGVSIAFHGVLLVGLATWYVTRSDVSDDEENAAAGSFPANSSPQLRSPDVAPEQVAATLDRATEIHRGKSDEEKLSELEKQAAKLQQVASDESVDEIAEKFHAWMNTNSRVGQPAAEPVEGEFEFNTAQIHEVRRETSDDGATVYRAVLVDAAGRTLETEMPPDEGERAYATIEKLKRFPLADKVYRQIAMPLMDKAIATGEKAPAKPPIQDDDRDPFDDSP